MRIRATAAALLVLVCVAAGRAQTPHRLNAVIDLLERRQPVFGIYWPSNGGGRRGGDAPPARPIADLAKDALAYRQADFLFNGTMENAFDRGLSAYADFATAMLTAGSEPKLPFFG